MRFARRDVRDHIAYQKNGHGASYRRYRTLQRRSCLKIDFREVFGVDRFSSFATQSGQGGSPTYGPSGPILNHACLE